ncbi:MAG: cell division protein ZapE [Gammaproteobacteria bacterium]|nr:cell division protein ZapE [Gammaproteobacteria bacterium]
MTPTECYQAQCAQGMIVSDQTQLDAMQQFERVYFDLLSEYRLRQKWFALFRKTRVVKGLYLWGSVGIGKTFMMDCFYQSIPFSEKMRMHFHAFMAMVHQALKQHQGEKNPLRAISDDIARRAMVICFDEFFVSDVTDAMLLGGLFSELFKRGVTLIATSNTAPDNLYKNGLQRERFLPAIEHIKENTIVYSIHSDIDYRLRHLKEAGVFFSPLDALAEKNMQNTFSQLTRGEEIQHDPVMIQDRSIHVYGRTQDVIWFDFSDLCTVPRSQQDYLEIAKRYKVVLVSNVPVIPPHAKDMICLFVSLIDVLYDARIRLVISAAEPVVDLYLRGFMIMEYTRTQSRLLEMQSEDYFLTDK